MQRTHSRLGLVVLLLASCPVWAAPGDSTLSGVVKDSTGGVLPAAFVLLGNQDIGLTRNVFTDPTGAFTFSHLPPGHYQINISTTGFRRLNESGLELRASEHLRLEIVLQVGRVEETVTINAQEPATQTNGGVLRGVVDRRQVDSLPLATRDVTQLVLTQAGVVARDRSPTEGTGYAVNGARQNGVYYALDGGTNTDSYRHLSGVFPTAAAIEDVVVDRSSLSAEFNTPAVVSVTTRSGTNRIHGSAFEFLRNSGLNARDFFAAKRNALRQSQYGGTLSGPILPNKLFFFVSYQGLRARSEPQLTRQFLPTSAMRQGDFSSRNGSLIDPKSNIPFAANRIPLSRLSPVSQNLLRYLPVPASPTGERYIGYQDRSIQDEATLRMDYNSGSHHMTGRYFQRMLETPFGGNVNDLASMNGPGIGRSEQPYSNLVVTDTWIATPNLMSVTSAVIRQRRTWNDWSSVQLPIDFRGAGIQGLSSKSSSMYINVAGNFLARPGWNYDKQDRDLQFGNTLTVLAGRHDLKLGGEYLRVRNFIQNDFRTMGNFDFTGAISGDAMADFLLGAVYQFWQGGGEYKALRGNRVSLFAQDEWRVHPALTLSLGLRWDPVLPFQDELLRTQCFVPGSRSTRFPNAPPGYLNAGDADCPSGGFEPYLQGLAPRLGFAFRPGRQKTVIRGGAGLFWNPQFTVLYNGFVNSAPFSPQVTRYGVDFSRPYDGAVNPFPQSFAPFHPQQDVAFAEPLGRFGSFAPSFRPAYSINTNLTLQRLLTQNWTARASYVANLGRHLSYNYDVNAALYGDGATTQNLQQRRPSASFSSILIAESGTSSNYHALELSLAHQGVGPLQFELNYTWSKSIDEYSEDSVPGQSSSIAMPFNRRAGRAVSDFDLRHQLTASWLWSVPQLHTSHWSGWFVRDWSLSGIGSIRTGLPFSVRSGTDRSLSGVGQDFADLRGNPWLDTGRPKSEQIAHYFNVDAFSPAALGTFGNAPRNLLRGPGAVDLDLAANKTLVSRDRVRTLLRAEFYNALNHANLGLPFASVNNPARLGQIESSSSARVIQLAIRCLF